MLEPSWALLGFSVGMILVMVSALAQESYQLISKIEDLEAKLACEISSGAAKDANIKQLQDFLKESVMCNAEDLGKRLEYWQDLAKVRSLLCSEQEKVQKLEAKLAKYE